MVDSGPNKFHLSSRVFLFLKYSNNNIGDSELMVLHFEVDARKKNQCRFVENILSSISTRAGKWGIVSICTTHAFELVLFSSTCQHFLLYFNSDK